jgi:hypothetical protein
VTWREPSRAARPVQGHRPAGQVAPRDVAPPGAAIRGPGRVGGLPVPIDSPR